MFRSLLTHVAGSAASHPSLLSSVPCFCQGSVFFPLEVSRPSHVCFMRFPPLCEWYPFQNPLHIHFCCLHSVFPALHSPVTVPVPCFSHSHPFLTIWRVDSCAGVAARMPWTAALSREFTRFQRGSLPCTNCQFVTDRLPSSFPPSLVKSLLQ